MILFVEATDNNTANHVTDIVQIVQKTIDDYLNQDNNPENIKNRENRAFTIVKFGEFMDIEHHKNVKFFRSVVHHFNPEKQFNAQGFSHVNDVLGCVLQAAFVAGEADDLDIRMLTYKGDDGNDGNDVVDEPKSKKMSVDYEGWMPHPVTGVMTKGVWSFTLEE